VGEGQLNPSEPEYRAWCSFRNLAHTVHREARHVGSPEDVEGKLRLTESDFGLAVKRCPCRLIYVAITRTSGILVLSSLTSLPRNLAYRMGAQIRTGGNRTYAPTIASRFLSELGHSRPAAVLGRTAIAR
jgi:hypothetical protein